MIFFCFSLISPPVERLLSSILQRPHGSRLFCSITSPADAVFNTVPQNIRLRRFRAYKWQFIAGTSAVDNDWLSTTASKQFPSAPWFHVSAQPGAHVIALPDDPLIDPSTCSRDIRKIAAGLAAFYSKARGGGSTVVGWTSCGSVSKREGSPVGQVIVTNQKKMTAKPLDPSKHKDLIIVPKK